MTYAERLKKMLEGCGTGRPATEAIVLILLAEGELAQLSTSASTGDGAMVAAVQVLLKDLKALVRSADTALVYGAEVLRSGSTAGVPARDSHLRIYIETSNRIQQQLAALRKMVGIPF